MRVAAKNQGHFLAFSNQWFEKYQSRFLWLLNSKLTRRWFRWVLCIDEELDICAIGSSSFTVSLGKGKYRADFRTHPKYGKRVYYAFKPLWWALHAWDSLLADQWAPQWSFGFDVLTAYPDPNPETSTVDGMVRYNLATSWADAHDSTVGTTADDSSAILTFMRARRGSDTEWYVTRGFFLFDTSSINDSATLVSATFSIAAAAFGKTNADSSSLDVVLSSPASNTALVVQDYDQVGSTLYGSLALTSWIDNDGTYNDVILNPTGLAAVSLTGISKFGVRNSRDTSNLAPTGDNVLTGYMADQAGTSTDPKLVVVFVGVSSSPSNSPSQSPSASTSPSQSPSASISPSISPSASPSVSPSASISPSNSPSQSPSASISPSKSPSTSPSASISPSNSPSQSPSASISPSISPSQSPSVSVSPSISPSASPTQSPSASVSPSASPSPSPGGRDWTNQSRTRATLWTNQSQT